MSMTMEYRLIQGHFDAFEEAIASAKAEIEEGNGSQVKRALFAKKLGRVIHSSLEIPRILKLLCDSTLDLVAARLIEDYRQTEQELRGSFTRARRILLGIEEIATTFEQEMGKVTERTVLRDAISQLDNLDASILANWPRFSEQDITDALREEEQGQCLDLDEGFARIAGVDKAAWLQHAEAHKRANPS